MSVVKLMCSSLVAGVMLACAGNTPAPSAASAEEAPPVAAPSSEAASKEATENSGPRPVEVAVDAAQAVADAWDGEKAKAEEVTLTLRIRVDGKPASVKGSPEGANLLDDMAGAAQADMTIDLTLEQGVALSEGKISLKSLVESGEIKVDNAQGLERFLQFVK